LTRHSRETLCVLAHVGDVEHHGDRADDLADFVAKRFDVALQPTPVLTCLVPYRLAFERSP